MSTRVVQVLGILGDSTNRLIVVKDFRFGGMQHVFIQPKRDVIPTVDDFFIVESTDGQNARIRFLRQCLSPEIQKAK